MKITDKLLRTIFSMHDHGIGSREIADSLNIGYSTTCRFVKAHETVKKYVLSGNADDMVATYETDRGNAACIERVFIYATGKEFNVNDFRKKEAETECEQLQISFESKNSADLEIVLRQIIEKAHLAIELLKGE